MEILLLTTPTQHQSDNPAVELKPKRLKAYLEDAPVMNVLATVRYLEKVIEPFNQISLDATDRLALLEIIHQYYGEILVSYDDLRLSMLAISPEEKRKLSLDIMWLYLNLANGYKIIIKEVFEHSNGLLREQHLALCLYRAVEQIIHAMLHSFRAHEPPAPLSYLELHQIYHYASKLNLANKVIKKLKGVTVATTIGSLYKQITLMVICDPYRISSRSMLEYFMALENYVDQLSLHDAAKIQKMGINYLINPYEDAPPQRCTLGKSIEPMQDGYLFTADMVIQAINNQLVKLQNQGANYSNGEARLLKNIIDDLRGLQRRRGERAQVCQKIRLWAGMDSTHYFLHNPKSLDSIAQVEVSHGIELSEIDNDQTAEFALSNWVIQNESERGYMLEGDRNDINLDNLIGEVVGIVRNDHASGALPSIGIIRWERGASEGRVKLGVELLKGTPQPIKYFTRDDSAHHCGICFHSSDDERKIIGLVIKHGQYRAGESIELKLGMGSTSVAIANALLQSPLYCYHLVRQQR